MSESDLAKIEREIVVLLDRLDRLYEEAAVAIENITDPNQAFRQATSLAEQARTWHGLIATRFGKLRAREAVRIRDAEALSIQGLATRISVSKARADQLVRAAKAKGAP